MIKDSDYPHFSERGKKQMVENLMAALRIAQADIASYAFVVNDHFVKVKRDPHRPSPKARFNRHVSSHTGVPDPVSKRSPPHSSESKDTPPLPLMPRMLRQLQHKIYRSSLPGSGPHLSSS